MILAIREHDLTPQLSIKLGRTKKWVFFTFLRPFLMNFSNWIHQILFQGQWSPLSTRIEEDKIIIKIMIYGSVSRYQ